MIAASAAILLFGPTAAVASAQPDPAQNLPAELVAAVARDLKISPEEYLHRADVAQQVAAFASTAQRQYPAVFGGSWLDDNGKAVVALAQGPGADEARKAAQSAGFEVRNVAKSESALRGEKSAFERWLDGQPEAVSSLVNCGLCLKPSAAKKAIEALTFLTGRLTKIMRMEILLFACIAGSATGGSPRHATRT